MATAIEIKLDKKAISPTTSSVYSLIGRAYLREECDFSYSDNLVITSRNYSGSKQILEEMIARGELPEGAVISTAAMEHALDLASLREGIDPRQAKHNNDLFARNKEEKYRFLWTSTLLRTPAGRKSDRYETNKKGSIKYPRDVFEFDEQVGEMLVPQGNGLVVVEFDHAFGVPSETKVIDYPHKGYYAHFWFDESKPEVAVGRRGDWHRDGDAGCLLVNANYERWDADSDDGFRPVVRGSGFEIEKFRLVELK